MNELLATTSLHQETAPFSMSILPNSLYKTGEPLLTKHSNDPDDAPEQTRSFLLGYADLKLIEDIFDENGRLKFESNLNPYSLHGNEITQQLGRELDNWYNLVQKSYLKGHDGDFNNHLVEHVAKIGNTADLILQHSPYYSEEQSDNALIAGILHDIGGLLARSAHAHLGTLMAADLFPYLLSDRRRFVEVATAIDQHDEKYFSRLKGYAKETSFERRSETLRNTQTPLSAAILIADKSDVDRKRVHKDAHKKTSMDKHVHTEVNMFTKDKGISITDDAIVWSLAFNPFIDKAESTENWDLVLNRESQPPYIAYGSKRVRNNPENPYEGINFEKVWENICRLYGPKAVGEPNRIQIMVDSALTWFKPKFVIEYFNPHDENQVLRMELTAENVDEFFAQMAETTKEQARLTAQKQVMKQGS